MNKYLILSHPEWCLITEECGEFSDAIASAVKEAGNSRQEVLLHFGDEDFIVSQNGEYNQVYFGTVS